MLSLARESTPAKIAETDFNESGLKQPMDYHFFVRSAMIASIRFIQAFKSAISTSFSAIFRVFLCNRMAQLLHRCCGVDGQRPGIDQEDLRSVGQPLTAALDAIGKHLCKFLGNHAEVTLGSDAGTLCAMVLRILAADQSHPAQRLSLDRERSG